MKSILRCSALGALLVVLVLLPPAGLDAQTIRVGVDVTESTGGLLQDRFETALSELEDVEIAGPSDLAHYVVTVAVLCVPEPSVCDDARSYSVSITLSEPLTGDELRNGLRQTGDESLSDWEASPEANAYLQRFRQIHAVWATSWSREQLDRDVERLVRGIDARCLQKRRMLETRRRALLQRGDTAAARDISSRGVQDGEWLC